MGLRTARRISHVFVLDVPTYPRLLMVTDAAINIYPDLEVKADICQNAIELAHVLGIAKPKVAVLPSPKRGPKGEDEPPKPTRPVRTVPKVPLTKA